MTAGSGPSVDHLQRAADLIAVNKVELAAREARRALQAQPGSAEALLFGVFYLFDLLWGLFVWVVDPAITYAVLKGWIR